MLLACRRVHLVRPPALPTLLLVPHALKCTRAALQRHTVLSASPRTFTTKTKPAVISSSRPSPNQRPASNPALPSKSIPNARLPKQPPLSSPPPSSFTGTRGTPPPVPNSAAKEYPSQLLIYHARTGLILYVASFRLLALLFFIVMSVGFAPRYFIDPDESAWVGAAHICAGVVPLTFMVAVTPPFVTYIHLALPHWARMTPERLVQFAQHLPPSAILDITTVRWLWPRVTRLHVSELFLTMTPSGASNLRRNVPTELYQSRKWYHWGPIKSFYVTGAGRKVQHNGIWPEVLARISYGWRSDMRSKPLPTRNK